MIFCSFQFSSKLNILLRGLTIVSGNSFLISAKGSFKTSKLDSESFGNGNSESFNTLNSGLTATNSQFSRHLFCQMSRIFMKIFQLNFEM